VEAKTREFAKRLPVHRVGNPLARLILKQYPDVSPLACIIAGSRHALKPWQELADERLPLVRPWIRLLPPPCGLSLCRERTGTLLLRLDSLRRISIGRAHLSEHAAGSFHPRREPRLGRRGRRADA
jgi:hypothetical protein